MDEAIVISADNGPLGDFPAPCAGAHVLLDAAAQIARLLPPLFGGERVDLAFLAFRHGLWRQGLNPELAPRIALVLPPIEPLGKLVEIVGQLDFKRHQLVAAGTVLA